ncbi:threonylcarbamoyl-AMP synthase [Patescibacteria group bacterium]|nr:threonylcarbamoyl-AMP synthase [Patescibacteria group bacterium]MBU1683057.1 threonylcarbamoyl-AMP synthase [Patescibacteria group bacterium]MBU1934959.1 threonylcarbamoyl-AMP synthase [Patescibacteria group bacterium]
MKRTVFNQKSLKEAVKILKEGGVIAHPADTCYGLAADLMNEKALKKIQQIKKRGKDKPTSMMLPVFMKPEIGDYAVLDEFSSMVCQELFPGPVTLLLPRGKKVPDYFFPKSPYIGLRIPYDMITQDLLSAFGGPLITTSANIADKSACCIGKDVEKIFENVKDKPDLIFKGAVRNVCMPSTVILVEKKKLIIKREGPMTKEQIEGILGVDVA